MNCSMSSSDTNPLIATSEKNLRTIASVSAIGDCSSMRLSWDSCSKRGKCSILRKNNGDLPQEMPCLFHKESIALRWRCGSDFVQQSFSHIFFVPFWDGEERRILHWPVQLDSLHQLDDIIEPRGQFPWSCFHQPGNTECPMMWISRHNGLSYL